MNAAATGEPADSLPRKWKSLVGSKEIYNIKAQFDGFIRKSKPIWLSETRYIQSLTRRHDATENFGSHNKKFVIDGKNMKRITKNARK